MPASGASGGNGRGFAGLANSLAVVSKLAFAVLERLRHVVDFGVAKNPVQNPAPKRSRKADIRFVGQDDDAEFLVGHQADKGAEAQRVAVVPDDVAIRRLLNDPAQGVGQLVGERDLRRAGNGEILRRDDAASFEGAVAELQADPARHVLDGGVDVAGPTEVVGEELG